MSDQNPVVNLLARLHQSSDSIAEAYQHGRIHKNEDNIRDIERLRQLRLLSPDIRDAFQLRGSFRQFLNTALNTGRLYSMGANISGYFQRLEKLVEDHSIAFQEARDIDCENYEVDIREAIGEIADAIEDELIILQAQVATRFAAVSTISEKKRQNLHYQDRTQQLVNLLENFHFSDLGEQLDGHEELALSFRSLLTERMPAFRQSLISILETLNQYLFEFRQIEARAKLVRAFELHLNRNLDWAPKDWDEVANPELWLQCAMPIQIQSYPEVSAPDAEELFAEIARTIPARAGTKIRTSRPLGQIESSADENIIKIVESPIVKAIRTYYKESIKSPNGISARKWWLANPGMIGNLREDIWLLRVLAENDKKGKNGLWSLREISEPDPVFDGNVLIHDVVVSRKAA